MIRVAIVGIGGYGRLLRPNILSAVDHGMCRIVAAADTRLEELGEDVLYLRPYCENFYDDALEMLHAHQGQCDAVFLIAGIASHETLTVAAAEMGYDIWLEKPPAATVQEVDRMISAVRDAGVLCQVAFRWVWSSDINFIKSRIVTGKLGRIECVTIAAGWPRRDYYYSRNDWAGELRSGDKWVLDGPATNALAHQSNNLLYLASANEGGYATPTAVRAELYAARDIAAHDTAAIEIETADRTPAYFLVSHCSETEFGPIIEVVGEKGTGRWTFADGPVVTYKDGSQQRGGREVELGRDKMVANFIQAVETHDASVVHCSLGDTRNYALVANGMHESSRRVHHVDGKFVQRYEDADDRGWNVIDGADSLIKRAAQQRCLFSDMSDAPEWTVRTERFDLAGYRSFPQQFSSEPC